MLSIGKLTAGRVSYYVAQLTGGREEYYTGGENGQPARWLGSAAVRLGLDGHVDADAFRRLLEGAHPLTGEPLGVPRTTKARRAGFDLCFSAPKSVSVAWALAEADTAAAIAAAHDRAVAQVIDVFETEVARARRGNGGATLVETDGVVAAAFAHRTSRSGDPQLHTHVVVPNVTVDADGRWSALAGDQVYRWAKTLGFMYQAALRAELSETISARWGPVRKGAADLTAVDSRLSHLFSTRRAQITAAMEQAGGASRAAAEIAALATRPAKDTTVGLQALRERWHAQAAQLGADLSRIEALGGPSRPVADGYDELAAGLLGPDGLTSQASSFDRRDVLQAVAAGHPDGIRPPRAVDAALRILDRPDVVALGVARPSGSRYSTAELLAVETRLTTRAARGGDRGLGVVSAARLASVLGDRRSLTGEQRAMVASLTTSGAGVEVVVGRAGSGKTFALDAARAAWEAAGFHVIGAALAARAAAELQDGSGIPATTIDRLLADLDRPGPLSPLRPGTIVVIDEAAMVGTRKLARLADHAERTQAKLVFVGDHRQLPEIEAGGAFAALSRVVPVTELVENRRQTEQWERDALAELRAASVRVAVAAYRTAGRVNVADNAETARQRLVEDWWQSYRSGEQAAIYALRRSDVDDLNRRARSRLDAAGLLGPDRLDAAGGELAVGDRVVCLRNDRRLGVRNGTRSTITAVDIETGEVVLADGVILPREYVTAGHVGHAYATTVHKAQGATVDRVFLLGSDALYREAGYVGLSRARQASHLYLVAGHADHDERNPAEVDPLAETIRRLSESKAQTLAADQLHPPRPTVAGPAPTNQRQILLADPDPWLLDALGPPPVTDQARDRWVRHAERLAAYRDIYEITATDPLGPQPDDPLQRRAWNLARLSLLEHQRSLDVDQGLQL